MNINSFLFPSLISAALYATNVCSCHGFYSRDNKWFRGAVHIDNIFFVICNSFYMYIMSCRRKGLLD